MDKGFIVKDPLEPGTGLVYNVDGTITGTEKEICFADLLYQIKAYEKIRGATIYNWKGEVVSLFLVVMVTLVGSFALLITLDLKTTVSKHTILAIVLLFFHITLYFVLLVSTHFALYKNASRTDGMNVINRVTVKVPNQGSALVDFSQSGFPDSISSSVAGRGTSMNKIMVGIGYSLGLTLGAKFLFFLQPDIDTVSRYFIGIGYGCIIFTSQFENRMNYVTVDRDEKTGKAVLTEYPSVFKAYDFMHFGGVLAFFVGPLIGFAMNLPDTLIPLILSIIGLVLGGVFLTMTYLVDSDNPIACLRKKSLAFNRGMSIFIISLEFTALTTNLTAGILFRFYQPLC